MVEMKIMNTAKKIIELLKQTFKEWQEDHVSRLAAALAYYTIFSLAPLLIIAITIAGLLWSRDAVETQVLTQMQGLIGAQGAEFVEAMLQDASANIKGGIIATIVGVVLLIFGAIGVFKQLRDTLNTIWEIPAKETEGFWQSIKSTIAKNLFSFAMVVAVGFLLLVSLIISTSLTALGDYISTLLALPDFVLIILNFVVTLLVIGFVFALLFKFLPETSVAWKDVLLGGFVTAFLFMLGKYAIGLYLGNSSVGVSFGAAGSLAVLLVWIYYSAQIVFFGAEFTQVYANKYGSKIRPTGDTDATDPEPSSIKTPAMPRSTSFHKYPAGNTLPVRHVSPYSFQLLPQRQNTDSLQDSPRINFLDGSSASNEGQSRSLR